MPNIQSNKKRVLTNEKSQLVNKRKKTFLKNTLRKFNDAVEAKDVEKALEFQKDAVKYLDRSVSSNIHHKNYANRKKSHLTQRLNAIKS